MKFLIVILSSALIVMKVLYISEFSFNHRGKVMTIRTLIVDTKL